MSQPIFTVCPADPFQKKKKTIFSISRHRQPVTDRPDPFYEMIFPPEVDLEKVAFEFEAEIENTHLIPAYRATVKWIDHWQGMWQVAERPYLTCTQIEAGADESATIRVEDRRRPQHPVKVHRFTGAAAAAYLAIMDRALGGEEIRRQIEDRFPALTAEELTFILEDFASAGLVLSQGERHLALAVEKAWMP